jgi:hypothetical protein
MMKELMARFESSFREWVESACKEWKYPSPSTEFYSNVKVRLPDGLRATLGFGLNNGIILATGHTFSLKGLPSSKGPYNWFSRYSASQIPNPNWEYYVQVAEYVRLYEALVDKGYTLTFEDSLMDIGVYDGDKLIVFCEVKENSNQALALVQGVKQHEQYVDLNAEDRGNDPLRKAKYIIEHKPEYFCVVERDAAYSRAPQLNRYAASQQSELVIFHLYLCAGQQWLRAFEGCSKAKRPKQARILSVPTVELKRRSAFEALSRGCLNSSLSARKGSVTLRWGNSAHLTGGK